MYILYIAYGEMDGHTCYILSLRLTFLQTLHQKIIYYPQIRN